MENPIDSNLNENNLNLNGDGVTYFKETRKWSMFLSVTGFVFLGILLIFAIYASTSSGMAGTGMPYGAFIPFSIILAVYFFPIYYLLKFSISSKHAIDNNDSVLLSEAMKYLKMHYKYISILLIVILGIYLIIGIVALSSGNLFKMF